MKLKKIFLKNWKQYHEIEFNFHERVTIITGENGTGKTTLLKILADTVGWNYYETINKKNMIDDLLFNRKNQMTVEEIEIFKKRFLGESNNYFDNNTEIGNLILSDDNRYNININKYTDTFNFLDDNEVQSIEDIFKGIYIPSYRNPFLYTKIESIPLSEDAQKEMLTEYIRLTQNKQLNKYYSAEETTTGIIKKSIIISAINNIETEKYKTKDNVYSSLVNKLLDYLSKMFPTNLNLSNIFVVDSEVYLTINNKDILIDELSSGLGSILELTWQLLMAQYEYGEEFTVIIDELENHLHPSLQKVILPNLCNVFPKVQFIVTSHSPFIVSSVKESVVYALTLKENNTVQHDELNMNNKFITSNKVLKEILGVTSTLPVWKENQIENIVNKYKNMNYSDDNEYDNFIKEIESLGLLDNEIEILNKLEVSSNEDLI